MLETIVGEDEDTAIPPLVIVKPHITAFVGSPFAKITADKPFVGSIVVSTGPFALASKTAFPLKLIDS